ncbi:MAG TPA: dihydrofolate reductase family protein [Gemmatimonadales bacterium]|nr:dihydrofolate reductase family protein [Gemmatimonadales bacterium]
MRRIRYSVAMSLDGFIAGPQGEYDWIPNEPEIDWGAFMARFDTVLMGRRSYEAASAAPGGSVLPGMATYVFSRTLRPEDHPGVTIVGTDLEPTIADLRRRAGKEIWLFGGGDLFRSLLERGYVDLVEIGLVPILLGSGVPFLAGLATRVALHLTDMRRYPTGIVLLTYAITRDAT